MSTKRNKRRKPSIPGPSERVMTLARTTGLLRTRDLDQQALPREYLTRLLRQGQLERVSRGVYRPVDMPVTEHHTLAVVAKRVPGVVICLLSALRFHGLTTQAPVDVWVAIDRSTRWPAVNNLPLRVFRFSGPAYRQGIERHVIEGVTVQVTSPAKTVTDCFKYRHKIGLDIALEALRQGWRERRFTLDELMEMARVCRVANVMRPYLQAITA